MSYTRRAPNFPKQNPPLSAVGQRRTGNNFGNMGGQNKPQIPQQVVQPQNPVQQQQQQFQSQLQQQEKARIAQQQAAQNQPPKQPVQQNPKPPQQQPMQKLPQQQPMQKPPQQQPMQKPPQQQQTQKPPQQQQQQIPKPPLQNLPQVKQEQQAPVQKSAQTPFMQQNAEQIIGEQSNNQPVLSTNSVDIPGLSNESANVSTENAENAPQHKNRPFWMKRNGNGRINRAERAKRRNMRLRKLLQPKNALMIINELVGHVPFELSETKTGGALEDLYKAVVTVDSKEHVGYGKSKALAKTAAAEAAVRSMILTKLKVSAQPPPPAEEDNKEDVKMEVSEDGQDDVSWTHIASFAIHKLFSGWDEDGNVGNMMSRTNSLGSIDSVLLKDGLASLQTQPEQKPAKRLPENAALMNPIMLLNQMHPAAKYEELGKAGAPPHVTFTIKCIVGAQSFIGNGPNKKAAKKQAAFEACTTLLGIHYPPDILQGTSGKPVPMETS